MTKTLIISDIDGVLVDFITGLIKQVWDKFGILMQYNEFTSHIGTVDCVYNKINSIDGSYSYFEVESFFEETILFPDFISSLSPFYKYLDVLQRLIRNKYRMDCAELNCSYTVYFLSNRDCTLYDCTSNYLSHWDLDADLYLCRSKEKLINYYLEFDYEEILVIEDNVDAVKNITDERVVIYIREQPWNGDQSDVYRLYGNNGTLVRVSEDVIVETLSRFLPHD
jgi:hypothetical protein